MIVDRKIAKEIKKQESYYMASQWKLMAVKLRHHKLAIISFVLLGVLYFGAIFAQFLAPQGLEEYSSTYANAPPSSIHFVHEGKLIGPFVYSTPSSTKLIIASL